MARRRLAPPTRAPAPPPPAGGDAPEGSALSPVLVDYFGRDGSTAMMRLLASSPEVLVAGGYPYEAQPFTRILLAHGCDGTGADAADPGSRRLAVEADWAQASRGMRAAEGAGRPSIYAEKLFDARRFDRAAMPPVRMIAMLRDPRDTFVSVELFRRAVGDEEMGGRGGEELRLERFVERQRDRLRWIAGLAQDETTMTVAYRDLIEDMPGLARRLSSWLGVDVAPERVPRDFRLRWVHATSADPAASVGRWRTELSPAVAAALTDRLGPEMRELGFID